MDSRVIYNTFFIRAFSVLKHLILSQTTNGLSLMHNRFSRAFFIHTFAQFKGGKVAFKIKNFDIFRNACIRPHNSLYRPKLPKEQQMHVRNELELND